MPPTQYVVQKSDFQTGKHLNNTYSGALVQLPHCTMPYTTNTDSAKQPHGHLQTCIHAVRSRWCCNVLNNRTHVIPREAKLTQVAPNRRLLHARGLTVDVREARVIALRKAQSTENWRHQIGCQSIRSLPPIKCLSVWYRGCRTGAVSTV